jgi:hypothetical protein
MRNDWPEDDPKKIWQTQPTEPSAMTLEKIRQKTQELHAKTRRDLFRGMTLPLMVAGISAWGIKWGAAWDTGPVVRAVSVLAIAWSLAGQYFGNRGMWSATPPGDAASGTGLESYRWEVERRRYVSGRFLLWYFGPVALALATLVVPLVGIGIRRGMLLNMTPFLTVLVVWVVGVFVVRMRQRRQLQREIDELNEIEGVNR